MDILDKIEEIAQSQDDRAQITSNFVKEHLPTCRAYAIVIVDEDDHVLHYRWNMAPWKLRGAFDDIRSDLSSIDVRVEMQDE